MNIRDRIGPRLATWTAVAMTIAGVWATSSQVSAGNGGTKIEGGCEVATGPYVNKCMGAGGSIVPNSSINPQQVPNSFTVAVTPGATVQASLICSNGGNVHRLTNWMTQNDVKYCYGSAPYRSYCGPADSPCASTSKN